MIPASNSCLAASSISGNVSLTPLLPSPTITTISFGAVLPGDLYLIFNRSFESINSNYRCISVSATRTPLNVDVPPPRKSTWANLFNVSVLFWLSANGTTSVADVVNVTNPSVTRPNKYIQFIYFNYECVTISECLFAWCTNNLGNKVTLLFPFSSYTASVIQYNHKTCITSILILTWWWWFMFA